MTPLLASWGIGKPQPSFPLCDSFYNHTLVSEPTFESRSAQVLTRSWLRRRPYRGIHTLDSVSSLAVRHGCDYNLHQLSKSLYDYQ